VDEQLSSREPAEAVPYPFRVAAAVCWRFLAVAGTLTVIGYVVVALRVVVIPLAVALLLTAGLGPLVGWLTRRRVPRGLATAVVVIGGLAGFGGVLVFVIQAFVTGLPDLRQQVSSSVEAIRGFLDEGPFGLPPVNLNNLFDQMSSAVSSNTGAITSGALSTAASVGEFLTGLVLAIFALIIFLFSGGSIWQFLLKLVPAPVRSDVDVAGQRSFATLVGYARGTVLVAVVDAVGIGIGLLAVGAPLVIPLTALIFLAAFVPIVGAVVSGALAVLVVLVANGLIPALIVLGVVLGVQQLEGNVLQPLIMGRAVQLNALAVVLAVAVGAVLAGITGALLAVPLLAALNTGIRSLARGDAAPEAVDHSDPAEGQPPRPDEAAAPEADRAGEVGTEGEPAGGTDPKHESG
jgi:predicted PurR-regulated permease PerM